METERRMRARHRVMAAVGLVLLTAFLACSVHEGADFKTGVEAYDRGDYATALKEWRPLAQWGVPDAQNNLGLMYRKGQGVPQNYKEAVRWYRLAAEQGEASAQSNLGVMYSKGHGVPQDYEEAVRWSLLAAEQGHPKSQFNLGVIYSKGQGVPQNYVLAHKWLNLSAVEGDKKYEKRRTLVELRMSPVQLAEAQRLAREWRPKTEL